MYHFGKRLSATLCAGSMLLSLTAFADETTPVVTSLETPEMTQWAVMYDFYQAYGWENAVDVYYNGVALAFPDAQPMAQEGTTFVPIRTFADALGATTDYDADTNLVTLTQGDSVVSFVIGSADVDVNGTVTTLPTQTFALENRTYVPLRLISEAFGLDVTWNGTYRQVAINDMEALLEGIHTDYIIANSLLAFTSGLPQENVAVTGTFDLSYTTSVGLGVTFNSDMTAIADKDLETLSYQMDGALDLGELEQVLTALLSSEGDETVTQLATTLLEAIKSFQVNYILDITTFDIYLQCDLLPVVGPFLLADSGLDTTLFDENPWIKVSYADLLGEAAYTTMMDQMNGILDQATTTTYTVASLVELMMGDETNPAEASTYAALSAILSFLKDDNFAEYGAGYQLADDLSGLAYALTVTMNDEGVVTDYTFTVDCTELALVDGPSVSMDLDMKQTSNTDATFTLALEVDMGEDGVFTLDMDFTSATTQEAPLSVPDQSLDMMELMGS